MKIRLNTIFSYKVLARAAFAVACVFTVCLVAFTIENIRGLAAWQRYKANALEKGAKLELNEFKQPAIPDAENFAAIPLLKELQSPDASVRDEALSSIHGPMADFIAGKALRREHLDLREFRDSLVKAGAISVPSNSPARDILSTLRENDPILDEMRGALSRPYSRLDWPLPASGADLTPGPGSPIGQGIRGLQQILSIQVLALLELRESPAAAADIALMFRLAALFKLPELGAEAVRVSLFGSATSCVWRGLADSAWSDHDLELFENELGSIRSETEYEQAWQGWRAYGNEKWELLQAGKVAISDQDRRRLPWIFQHPKLSGGLIAQNQVWMNEWVDANLAAAQPAAAANPGERAFRQGWRWKLYGLFDPGTIEQPYRPILSFFQVDSRLCLISCGLERWRLAHGSYPDSIAPVIADRGFLSSAELEKIKYRRPEANRPGTLYLVGEDGVDHGGDPKREAVWDLLDRPQVFGPENSSPTSPAPRPGDSGG